MEVGDEVITAGGIYGTVRALDDDTLEIEVARGIVLTLAGEAIARRRVDRTRDPAEDDVGRRRPRRRRTRCGATCGT